MQLTTFAQKLTGKTFDDLFVGARLVRFAERTDGSVTVAKWDASLGTPPTDAQIDAALAAPEPGPDLPTYAAARRYAVETGGIVLNGAVVATDRESQAMIANALAYVQASGAASVRFKAASGWVTLAADQLKMLALAVGAHVQAAFAVEDDLDAGIHASPPTITTAAQIDAAAWPANAPAA